MAAASRGNRAAQTEALLELMRRGAAEPDPTRAIELICECAAKLGGADYAAVRLAEPDGLSEWRGVWGASSNAWRRPRSPAQQGAAVDAVATGRTTISRHDPEENARRLHPDSIRVTERTVVELATPLVFSGRTIGALVLGWRQEVTPTADQVQVVELLGGYGAAVLAGARSREESERRRAEAEALAELARRGAAAHEPEAVASLVCRSACALIGADFASLLVRPPNGYLWLGVAGQQSRIWREPYTSSGRGPAATSMAENRAVVFQRDDRPGADGRMDALQMLAAEETETALAVPLRRAEGPLGALLVGWRTPHDVTQEQRRLAEALGGYAVAVLDNALSHLESERRRIEAEALAELVRAGASEQDPERAISIMCERGCRLLSADYAALSLVEAGRRVWYGAAGMRGPDDSLRWFSRGRGHGPTAMALNAGRAVVLERIQSQDDPSLFHMREGGQTAIAAPCVGRDGLRGALHFGWRRELPIAPAQLRLAEALASYATVVIENAHAHAALRDRAEAISVANEQLTRVDEMKNNLISNVSHELRTPLSSIRAFSELLLDTTLDSDTQAEFARIINLESERLTRLVGNLLDLSRIQARGVTWQIKPLDVQHELEQAVVAMRPAAEEKQLPIRLEIEPGATRVCADADGLQQALMNLIANAVKFTSAGEVTVAAEVVADGVRICVRDTGAGLSAEDQARIFDRFYQAGNILTAKPAGTGLGLAITKEILLQLGSDISVDSAVGRGSTFSFVLPAPNPG